MRISAGARSAASLLALGLATSPGRARADMPGDNPAYIPPQAYSVHMRLASDRPDLNLGLVRTDGHVLCAEPCDAELQIKEYERFRVLPARANPGVAMIYEEIPPFALPPENPDVSLRIESGHPERRVAGAMTFGGGSAIAGLGLLTGLGASGWLALHSEAERTQAARTVRNVGFSVAAVGAFTGIIGILILAATPPPRATIGGH